MTTMPWNVLYFATALVLTVPLDARVTIWPKISPLHMTRTYSRLGGDAVDTPFEATIRAEDGTPLYSFECHNGNYSVDTPLVYSGDFQCALYALKGTKQATWTLLAAGTKDERSADWWNRGRMRGEQLRSPCTQQPEYSTDRHFKLRGMLVRMRFTNPVWAADQAANENPSLVGFKFELDVMPDSSAHGRTAALGPGAPPLKGCYP